MTGPIEVSPSPRFSYVSDAVAAITATFVGSHFTSAPAVGTGSATQYKANTVVGGPAQDLAVIGAAFTNIGAGTEASAFIADLRRAGAPVARVITASATKLLYQTDGVGASGYTGVAEFTSSKALGEIFNYNTLATGSTGFFGINDAFSSIEARVFGSAYPGAGLAGTAANTAVFQSYGCALGVGTAFSNDFYLGSNSIQRYQIAATAGHFLAFADNTYDCGASGATRFRTLYLATSARIGVTATLSALGDSIVDIADSNVNGTSINIRSGLNTAYAGFTALNNNGVNVRASLLVYGTGAAGTVLGVAVAGAAFTYSINAALGVGTIANQAMTLGTNNTGRAQFTTAGHFVAFLDATYDIGASGANRFRHLYLSDGITISSTSSGLVSTTSTATGGFAGFIVTNNAGAALGMQCFGNGWGAATIFGVLQNNLGLVRATASASGLGVGNVANVPITFGVTDVGRWQITSTALLAFLDATYNIGASGANRPANVYVSNTVQIGTGTFSGAFPLEISTTASYAEIRCAAASSTTGAAISCRGNNAQIGFDFTAYGNGVGGTDFGIARNSQLVVLGALSGSTFVLGGFGAQATHFGTNSVSRFQLSSTGMLLATLDATYDFGAAGANRVRDIYLSRNLTIGGALDHDGTTMGLFGVAPVTRPAAYTVTNPVDRRTFDTATVTLPQLAEIVGTIIADRQRYGDFA